MGCTNLKPATKKNETKTSKPESNLTAMSSSAAAAAATATTTLPMQKTEELTKKEEKKPEVIESSKPSSVSAQDWSISDAQLAADEEFKQLLAKYSAPCSSESLENAVKALTEQGHNVQVFNTGKEALDYLVSTYLKDNAVISMGSSTTLQQIGFVDYLKANDDKITNFKAKAVAAQLAGDFAAAGKYYSQGATANVFFSSVSALTETGEITAADLTGTRISGWLGAKELVLVLGSNKIVSTEEEAKKRLSEYQLKLESARVRVAFNVPASAIVNNIAIKRANPMGPRTTIVIIKESLGF